MNIHELSSRTNISLSNLRKLERLKVLRIDKESELAPMLRWHLARNQHMTVAQLLDVLAAPAVVGELGRYADRARAQLAEIGVVSAAPPEVTAAIYDAGKSDEASAEIIAAWLRDILPVEPVSYYWIAVRLLYGLPDTLKTQYAKRLNVALANVRKLDSFAGWFSFEKNGERRTVKYHKPLAYVDM